MNSFIDQLLKHRSIRKFKPDSISDEQLQAIVRSAQSASTSSNIQAYSIIRVTDRDKRLGIMKAAGSQQYVEECPLFLVFCADLHRLRKACELRGTEMRHEGIEPFLTASVDAALAAQNAAVAAESMGLGICYIGAIRNDPAEVSRLLELPELVYPVFGMCIGVPDQEPTPRPRLPIDSVLHTDRYETSHPEALAEYDEETRKYYRERTGGKKESGWTDDMAGKFAAPNRPFLGEFLKGKGFRL